MVTAPAHAHAGTQCEPRTRPCRSSGSSGTLPAAAAPCTLPAVGQHRSSAATSWHRHSRQSVTRAGAPTVSCVAVARLLSTAHARAATRTGPYAPLPHTRTSRTYLVQFQCQHTAQPAATERVEEAQHGVASGGESRRWRCSSLLVTGAAVRAVLQPMTPKQPTYYNPEPAVTRTRMASMRRFAADRRLSMRGAALGAPRLAVAAA